MADQLPQHQPTLPPQVWTQSVQPLAWGAATVVLPAVTYTATWKSPLFDLRPDLRSAIAAPKVGIPIWTRAGRLYVQFFGLEGLSNENLKMFATEFGNLNLGESTPGAAGGPTAIVPAISAPIEVTSVLSFAAPAAPGSAVLGYAPYSASLGGGDGYPIRYWYLVLTFVKIFDIGIPGPPATPAAPGIRIQAGFY